MANIQLSELNPAGSELFQDSENYLNELNEQEMGHVVGGYTFAASKAQSGVGITGISVSAQSNNGNTVNANTYGNFNTAVAY
ncbi:hypothetical protein IQ238_16135 [Pleurocapsales cyanobacterium LEGE 06147]|nr:hypothetical protein [Pleurocapsales cyanobacterium LEGE 06147]